MFEYVRNFKNIYRNSMPHFYLDDEFTKFLFSISTCLTFFQKVSEFVKLFNAITLMHYMTKKESTARIVLQKMLCIQL